MEKTRPEMLSSSVQHASCSLELTRRACGGLTNERSELSGWKGHKIYLLYFLVNRRASIVSICSEKFKWLGIKNALRGEQTIESHHFQEYVSWVTHLVRAQFFKNVLSGGQSIDCEHFQKHFRF